MFFLLSSFVLATDAFLYSFDKQHRTLISFDWSFAHGFDIGAILIFFVMFSFVMTIAAPLLAVASRLLLVLGWKASSFLVPCAAMMAWPIRALPLLGWLVFSIGFLPAVGEVIVLL